ncbi:MAG: hypothetical protein ILP19_02885, partial [Oscillospiraceae bacterium]|nr:hypothetical protein [Oscillospiraceae bacterium]
MAKKKNGKAQPDKSKPVVAAEPEKKTAAGAPAPVKNEKPRENPAPEKAMPADEEVPLTDGEWTTTENVFERIEEKKAEAARPVRTRVIQAPRRPDAVNTGNTDTPAEEYEERKTVHHGPPRTEEERRRILAAESLLDRDLNSAVRKRTAEEEEDIRRFEAMQKREAERVARLQANKEHREQLRQQAKEREAKARENADNKPLGGAIEHTSDIGTISHGTSSAGGSTADKLFKRDVTQLSAGRAVFVVFIMAVLAYVGLFIYTKHLNDQFYDELSVQLTAENKIVNERSLPYKLSPSSKLTIEKKSSSLLTPWLADTDKDGLSDDYELDHDSNPLLTDTDDDGIPDGLEVASGLDPLKVSTDGVLPDGEIRGDRTLSSDNVTVFIHGIPKPCIASIEPVGNNSINGSPGLVCNAEEFYTNQDFNEAELKFVYPANYVNMHGFNEDALSVFRFDSDKLEFVPVPSTIDKSVTTVSAVVKETGIYTVADQSVLMQKGKTQIFFLIDNSGSMYPEEMCQGSEENDIEFKRLDLSQRLVDMFGDTALYGAGEFSGTYTNIVPITGDTELVTTKIDAIRTRTNNLFTGTEISTAV